MKKSISLLLLLAVLFSILSSNGSALCAENTPVLKSISFDNAVIDGAFSEDTLNYSITLTDNSITPSLSSYEIEGDGELFVTYTYDDFGIQTGILATLNYENGSTIYTFSYSNPAVSEKSSDNFLTDIYCSLGEIFPKINKEDTKYTLYIPSDLTELTLTPVTSDTNASCPPLQLTLSEDQTPVITLKCTASDGSEREYSLEIKRVDKTAAQVKEEMAQEGYTSFVEEKKLYNNPDFLIIMLCAAAGILIIVILRKATIRMIANPYDEKEKPFYKE